jgi:gliding motility-associated lipoprotein GldH
MRILAFLILFLSLSCQHYFYDDKKILKDEIWNYSDSVSFEFDVKDTNLVYNIFLEVNHKSDYQFQNVYAKLSVNFPDGKERKQNVSLDLADARGEWKGKCSGKYCTSKLPFMPSAIFDQAGHYKMKFEQFSRQDSISGIGSLRLIIEQTAIPKEDSKKKSKQSKKI